jgi:tRNA nucleotidyltransferase/poly(A) polymerase
MQLSELLFELGKIAEERGLSKPYIVGGLPRDIAFGLPLSVKDVDITTGDKSSLALAMALNNKFPDSIFRSYDDGHSSVDFKNIRLDFSNNFKLNNIDELLKNIGVENPSELERELYSRDFTINTLLQDMDLSVTPLDLTGLALDDIDNKILKTPVDPDLTIGNDYRRILRALRLCIKFDLTIAEDLKKSLFKFRGGLKTLPETSIKKQINQMLEMNAKKTIDLLVEYKILSIIPLSKMMNLELVKNKMIQYLIEGD